MINEHELRLTLRKGSPRSWYNGAGGCRIFKIEIDEVLNIRFVRRWSHNVHQQIIDRYINDDQQFRNALRF